MPSMNLTVGDQANATGTNPIPTADYTGATRVSDRHPRYMEAGLRGSMFYASNNAAQALSVASATYTGLVVQNPVLSGKNLVMTEIMFTPTIVATGVFAVVIGFGSTQLAGVTVLPTLGTASAATGLSTVIGGAATSIAKVGASIAFNVGGASSAPTIIRPVVGFGWITAVSQPTLSIKDELAGSLIVPPGTQICLEAITTAITGFCYMSWEEVSVNA